MKIFRRIVLALMVLVLPFTLIGCKPKEVKELAANTWVYDDLNITFMTEDGKSKTSMTLETLGDQIEDLSDGEITQEQYEGYLDYFSRVEFKFNDDYSFDIGYDLTGTEIYEESGVKSIYLSTFLMATMNDSKDFELKDYSSYEIKGNKIHFNFEGCMEILKDSYETIIDQGATGEIPAEYEEMLTEFNPEYFLTIAEIIEDTGFKYEVKKGKSLNISYTIDAQTFVDFIIMINDTNADDISVISDLYDEICFELQLKK